MQSDKERIAVLETLVGTLGVTSESMAEDIKNILARINKSSGYFAAAIVIANVGGGLILDLLKPILAHLIH